MAKPYNPYNAIKGIYDAKVAYHTNQSLGKDPSGYHQQALPYYRELADNGMEELAAQLDSYDAVKAGELLKHYKPDEEVAFDNYLDSMTGNAGTVQNTRAYGADPSTQRLLDIAMGAGEGAQSFADQARAIGTGAVSTQPSDTVNDMLGQWQGGNERLNGQIRYDENGNVISGLNTAHYNIGREQLERINNFDVTKQPYYQGIMDQYRLGGYNAAQGAYANGAADNGGNIDSYAAANANRQQLAFTTAGQQAALAAAQQNANNWQTLYSQMSQDLNNQGVLNATTLQQAAQMYSVDAQERMSALDVAGAMERQAMANAINGYLGNIQADMQKYGIDAETAMNRENNKAAMEQITAQLAAQERMNTENNETTRLGYASQERMNTENNQTQRYGYDTNRDIAGINANAQLGVAGINRDATLGAAGINANASMTNAALQADLNRYLGKLGYKQALAGYQNALDQISAQSTANMSQAQYADKIQREYNQWLLDNGYLPSGVTLQNPVTGTTPVVTQTVAEAYDNKPDQFISDIYLAVMGYGNNGNTDYNMLSNFGIKKGMSVDDLRATLTGGDNGWGWSNTSKIISELQKQMEEDPNFAVKFNALFSDDIEKYIPRGTKTNGRADSTAE